MGWFKKKPEPNQENQVYAAAKKSQQNLFESINLLNKEIESLNTKLSEKDRRIKHLEELLRSDNTYVDKETKLYNREYYEQYVRPSLSQPISVITFTLLHFDPSLLIHQTRRQKLAKLLIEFCVNRADIPIYWTDNCFKLFLNVNPAKIQQVRQKIMEILSSNVDRFDSSLSISFRCLSSDPDLA